MSVEETKQNQEEEEVFLPPEFLNENGDLKSTMGFFPLRLRTLCSRAHIVNPNGRLVTRTLKGYSETTYGENYKVACQVANALIANGVKRGDRVGTLMFNNSRHFAVYHAVPVMGCVVTPHNVRLHRDELGWIIDHAGDRVIFIDSILLKALGAVDQKYLTQVLKIVVCGADEQPLAADALAGKGEKFVSWEDFINGQPQSYEWPDVDENAGCALCYTSGTTGKPKGVLYSHRAVYLHTFTLLAGPNFSFNTDDVLCPVVPMFHALGWGLSFVALTFGFDLCMTNQYLKPNFCWKFSATKRSRLALGFQLFGRESRLFCKKVQLTGSVYGDN